MSGKRWWLHIASILLLFLSYGPVGVLGGDQEENKELALSILTFFVLMLVIGIAVGMLIRYIKLPYTAVLIVSLTIHLYLTLITSFEITSPYLEETGPVLCH